MQRGDGGKLLDDLFQEDHLAGAVDVPLVFLPVLVVAEPEDRGGDLPHRREHALQRPHGELRHDAGERQAAEDHDEDHEEHVQHVQGRLVHRGLVHVEAHEEAVAVHQHRRGLARGLREQRLPLHEVLLTDEGLVAVRVALASRVRPVFAVAEEFGHLVELLQGALHVALPHEHGGALHPGLKGVVVLGEGEDVKHGHHHHKDDGEAGHARRQQVGQLPRDDNSDAARLLVRADHARQETEDAEQPGEAPCAEPHAARGQGLYEEDPPLGAAGHGLHVRLRGVLPQEEGDVKDHGDRAEDVHEMEEAEDVAGIRRGKGDDLHREEEEHQGQDHVQLRAAAAPGDDPGVRQEEGRDECRHHDRHHLLALEQHAHPRGRDAAVPAAGLQHGAIVRAPHLCRLPRAPMHASAAAAAVGVHRVGGEKRRRCGRLLACRLPIRAVRQERSLVKADPHRSAGSHDVLRNPPGTGGLPQLPARP
mmetsp:Transcript_116791/g.376951  ORF Transcript_116791/g.376951 Transcript_116791/m.376951 type:complete len:477 (+) Transcript_116791:1403-2833(+)